jgi:hypothetical protein
MRRNDIWPPDWCSSAGEPQVAEIFLCHRGPSIMAPRGGSGGSPRGTPLGPKQPLLEHLSLHPPASPLHDPHQPYEPRQQQAQEDAGCNGEVEAESSAGGRIRLWTGRWAPSEFYQVIALGGRMMGRGYAGGGGGSPETYKTRKVRFQIVFWFLVLVHVGLVGSLVYLVP